MNYKRSDFYRKNFFKRHKGFFNKNIYHCSYCGKLLFGKENVSVDHLISVHSVKKFGKARINMILNGITDINDEQNLVPSCFYCNRKKSSKGGIWLIRGTFGRHYSYWVFRKILRILIFSLMVYMSSPTAFKILHAIPLFSNYF